MTEFSSDAELDIIVNQSSLRSARKEIEQELNGAATVGVDSGGMSQLSTDGGGAGGAGELLQEQQQTNQHLSENLTLNDERNELLREIVENTDQGPGQGGGNNLGRLGRLGGLGGLLAGGLGIAALVGQALSKVKWRSLFSDALPNLNPGDILNPFDIGVGDVISGAPIGAGALIGESLPLGSGDLVGDPFPIGAAALLGAAFPLGIGAILSGAFPISPSDLVDGEGSGSGSGSSSPVADNRLQALAGATGVGLGAGALSGLSGGIGAGAAGGGAGGFAGATSGSVSAAALGPAAVVGGSVVGGGLATRELNQVASGGEGMEPVNDAGQDFAENNPGTAETIREGFENNLVADAGRAVGDELNGRSLFANGGIVTGPTDARIGEGGETEAVFPLSRLENFMSGRQSGGSSGGGGGLPDVNVDATVENVEVSGNSRRDIVSEVVREMRRVLQRELPDDFSREIQRGFESQL